MPLFNVDVQKQQGNEFWSNVYHVDAADVTEALTRGQAIANIEKAVHGSDVNITAVRARRAGLIGAETAFAALNIACTYAASTMPLAVCARVVFGNGTSRPGIKYLRTAVNPTEVSQRTTIIPARLTTLQTNYCDPLLALPYLRDSKNRVVLTVKPAPNIANHQLRRGSKRKLQPVITP